MPCPTPLRRPGSSEMNEVLGPVKARSAITATSPDPGLFFELGV